MHTTLITGGSESKRREKTEELLTELNVSAFDRIEVTGDPQTVGIKDVREFIKRIALKPQHGPLVAGIIPQSERLTPEAQQALLKTLEEPPLSCRIILTASSVSVLLPTVVSRCACISIPTLTEQKDQEAQEHMRYVETLLTKRPGEISRALAAAGKTREDALAFIRTTLEALAWDMRVHAENMSMPGKKTTLFHALVDAQKHIVSNVNGLLAIEHAFFARQG